jgi:hypothetical protein
VWNFFCARFAVAHLMPQLDICKDDILPVETKKNYGSPALSPLARTIAFLSTFEHWNELNPKIDWYAAG